MEIIMDKKMLDLYNDDDFLFLEEVLKEIINIEEHSEINALDLDINMSIESFFEDGKEIIYVEIDDSLPFFQESTKESFYNIQVPAQQFIDFLKIKNIHMIAKFELDINSYFEKKEKTSLILLPFEKYKDQIIEYEQKNIIKETFLVETENDMIQEPTRYDDDYKYLIKDAPRYINEINEIERVSRTMYDLSYDMKNRYLYDIDYLFYKAESFDIQLYNLLEY